MAKKVGIEHIISTGEEEGLKWKITSKRIDPTTGQAVAGDSKVGKETPRPKNLPQAQPKPEDKELQRTRYQEAKEAAGRLKNEISGEKVAAETLKHGNIETSNRPETLKHSNTETLKHSNIETSARPKNAKTEATSKEGIPAHQHAIARHAKPLAAAHQPQQAVAAPRPTVAHQNNVATQAAVHKKPEKGVEQFNKNLPAVPLDVAKAASNALQAGAVKVPAGTEKTSQLSEEIGDKNDELREDRKDGEAAEVSPWSHAKSAGQKLDSISSGLGGSGDRGGDESSGGFELTANRVDIAKQDESAGVKFFNGDAGAIGPKLAAVEYGGKIEKLLKSYIPLEKKVANWEPDKSVVERVVADTKAEIALAQEFLEAVRTRGKNSPSGYGWPV